MFTDGEVDDLLGAEALGRHPRHRIAQGLRGQGVLAIRAVVVASEHAERERPGAGERVKERLLLHRIQLERGDVSRRHLEAATLVPANLADAPLADGG